MNEQILNDFFNTIRNPQTMPVFGKFSKLLSGILPFHEKKVFKKISLFFSNFPALFCRKFKKNSIYHAWRDFNAWGEVVDYFVAISCRMIAL